MLANRHYLRVGDARIVILLVKRLLWSRLHILGATPLESLAFARNLRILHGVKHPGP